MIPLCLMAAATTRVAACGDDAEVQGYADEDDADFFADAYEG
jgi:hypothetical protein